MSNHVLKQNSKVLQNIFGKVDELKYFNKLFAQHLDPDIAKHCQIAKFEKNCLFAIVDNGSWATQLRFHIPDLMTKLKRCSGLKI